jgi:ABC-2 type transport system ATP-binding protein
MTVDSFLTFVGRLKGIAGRDVPARVESVMQRCTLDSVRHKQIGHLSKGYRQRVGLAQALIHNPQVLILDEPTAGLDPKQIIEVRQLIHELSREHTIILSTHILPEAAAIANRIIIINEGKLEASDTPENLTARMRGHESVFLEIDGPAEQVEARLLTVAGVSRVSRANGHGGRTSWEVEAGSDPTIRGALARAVVEAGWGLYEIRPVGLSLEDIFLKLTTGESDGDAPPPAESGEPDPAAEGKEVGAP